MLLTVSNVHKSYSQNDILTGVNFRIASREKVALVGRNGAGKTTLLKIITQQSQPDTGSVHLAHGAKIGYLRQEAPVDGGKTVLEEAQEALKRQVELQTRLEELEKLVQDHPSEEILEEYSLVHEHFLEAEGYSAEHDLKAVLIKMGFSEEEFDKPTAKLSGGEKTRLALARLLLEEPELLILDEPTNHLDLQATEWLEGWLRSYHGAVVLVSHDRTFLQNTAERILEMSDGEVKPYPGPFEKYLELKAEEEARQAEVAKRQEAEIAKMDEYVRRFMNSQRTAQARGRLKLMNRLIESKVEAPKQERGLKAAIESGGRSGQIVLECEKLSMSFGEEKLFQDLTWTARNGERWGVIGENGSGKSTLVKVLLGFLDPVSGRSRLGASVNVGYFSQDTSDLDLDLSPLDLLVYECDLLPADARNLLGRFLITGDDVYRPIRTLSGGEKNKLSLARLTTLKPNVLILDEPTNHLDMASRDALIDIIRDYPGTLVLVSHDRWLLANVTNHTLDLHRDGTTVQYPGSYTEYRAWKAKRNATSEKSSKPTQSTTVQEPETRLSPREISKEIQRLQRVVESEEEAVHSLERQVAQIEQTLATPPTDCDLYALSESHQNKQIELNNALERWEKHSLELEKMIALQG